MLWANAVLILQCEIGYVIYFCNVPFIKTMFGNKHFGNHASTLYTTFGLNVFITNS